MLQCHLERGFGDQIPTFLYNLLFLSRIQFSIRDTFVALLRIESCLKDS
jgi:hypothetical protein